MKSLNKLDLKYQNIILFIIIISGCLLRVLYIIEFDDYFDDWNFFYTVDPKVSNNETWQRHYFGDRGDGFLPEDFPWVFSYFTKFFLGKIGYSVEITHYFILFFSIISFYYIIKLCEFFTNNFDLKFLVLIIYSFNLFLIRELNTFRPHSLSVLLSLISLYYFFIIFLNQNYNLKNILIYVFSTIFFLLIWPLNLAFFFGQCAILIIFLIGKNKNKKTIIFLPLIILILYFLLNYKYLEYQVINKTWHYTQFSYKFFFNYFFKSFFGSIFYGAIMLILFTFFIFREFKDFYLNTKFKILEIVNYLKKDSCLLIIIFTIYSAMVTYSLIRASVMAPKYITVLLPIILIWISIKIINFKNKFIFYLIIFITITNTGIYWKKLQIERPPIKKMNSVFKDLKIKKIFTTESHVFNHFAQNLNQAIELNIKYKKINSLETKQHSNETIALVCMNYPRFAHGDYQVQDDQKCLNIRKKFSKYLVKELRIPDFLIYIIRT